MSLAATTPTVEQRLAHLEREVEALKRQVAPSTPDDWVARVTGSFEHEPEFDEVLRLGREIRRSHSL